MILMPDLFSFAYVPNAKDRGTGNGNREKQGAETGADEPDGKWVFGACSF